MATPGLRGCLCRRLPHAVVERVAGAGHWPWLDQPSLAERVAGFVTDTGTP